MVYPFHAEFKSRLRKGLLLFGLLLRQVSKCQLAHRLLLGSCGFVNLSWLINCLDFGPVILDREFGLSRIEALLEPFLIDLLDESLYWEDFLDKCIVFIALGHMGHLNADTGIQIYVLEGVDRAPLKFSSANDPAAKQRPQNVVLGLRQQRVKLVNSTQCEGPCHRTTVVSVPKIELVDELGGGILRRALREEGLLSAGRQILSGVEHGP